MENVVHIKGYQAESFVMVVNMPQGLGRYSPGLNTSFEWYLKNHLGSTMLVYSSGNGTEEVKAAYAYRSFGERIALVQTSDKVTEEFTGKELDEETQLNEFGARKYDAQLGVWISVDPARQFASPYLYAGNNPIIMYDPDGNAAVDPYSAIISGSIGYFWGLASTSYAYGMATGDWGWKNSAVSLAGGIVSASTAVFGTVASSQAAGTGFGLFMARLAISSTEGAMNRIGTKFILSEATGMDVNYSSELFLGAGFGLFGGLGGEFMQFAGQQSLETAGLSLNSEGASWIANQLVKPTTINALVLGAETTLTDPQ